MTGVLNYITRTILKIPYQELLVSLSLSQPLESAISGIEIEIEIEIKINCMLERYQKEGPVISQKERNKKKE